MNGKTVDKPFKNYYNTQYRYILSDTTMQKEQLIDNLNGRGSRKRLNALTNLCKNDEDDAPARSSDTAQFRSVYTGFSFTPSMCAYKAKQTGVVDYASLKGADEFSKALKITGVAGYIGVGINSRVKGMRIALQAIGVPHKNIKALHKNLADARNLKAAHVNRQRELINKKTDNLRLLFSFIFQGKCLIPDLQRMQIAAKRPVTFFILSQSYKLYRFNQQLNIF